MQTGGYYGDDRPHSTRSRQARAPASRLWTSPGSAGSAPTSSSASVEANVSAAVAHGFGGGQGTFVDIYELGPIAPGAVPNSTWLEYGGRVGYRVNQNLVLDAFLLGTAGGEVGETLHGGLALRFAF